MAFTKPSTMKRILSVFLLLAGIAMLPAQGQSIPKRIEQRAKDKTGNKVDESVDKSIDSAFNKTGRAIGNIFKKKDKSKKSSSADKSDAPVATDGSTSATTTQAGGAGNTGGSTGSTSRVNSTSDFVPGETVLFEEHFDKDALGDFPAQWNTNGSGRIVTIDGLEGK
jgi:hypothetical protein